MARYWYGDQPSDYVVAPGEQELLTDEHVAYQALLMPGIRLWCYDYDTGEQITDLLTQAGDQITEIFTAQYGRIPRFRGPDGVTKMLIGQAPDTDPDADPVELHRWTITSTDWTNLVSSLETRVGTLESGGGGDPGDPGEVIATAHPLVWARTGAVTSTTSPHRYINLEGRTQDLARVRAEANVTSGSVTVRVLTVDLDTQVATVVAEIPLTTSIRSAVVEVGENVTDGTGVTVQTELGAEDDEATDLTVQVMIR